VTAYPKSQGDDAAMSWDPARSRAPQQRRLIALTTDPALNRALQELASGDVAVSIVGDMRSLTDELMQHASATALIDAAALDAPVEGAVDAINTQFPDLRLMIAGHGAEQTMLAARIANQSVFRFVHKPASPQRLRLFLDAAARPTEPRSTAPAARPVKSSKEPLARIETAVSGKSPQTLAIIGVVAIAAIAAGAWAFWPGSGSGTSSQGDAATAAPVTPESAAALALIKQADQAFASGRYVAADGSSAAELYRAAQKQDSSSSIAKSGFDRAIEYALRSAEEALLAGRLNDASLLAEQLRLITPGNSRLAFLNTQISREQARVNADVSQRQASEARQAQIRAALAEMADRMRRGALIDPATNSAVSHFREAEAVGAGDPAVRSARETLIAALLTAADNELAARRPPVARRMIDAASSINSSAPGLDVLRRRVDEVTAQLAAASAEAAAQAARAAEPPAPAAEAAAPASEADAASQVVAANTLRVLRREDPVYPARALEQLTSGWVEMEFTVQKDGSVTDIIVTEASPRRTFDSAAMAALRRYRYAPVIRNGEAVPQRARMRMRFTAKETQ